MQFGQLKRREFITLLGGAAAACPLTARAQQPRLPVIGFVNSSSPDLWVPFVRAWHRGLSETGNAEGRNVTVEYRWAMGRYDRLAAMVAELVRLPVAVLAATSGPAALAAKATNTAVPIVFTGAFDPVRLGLVASLARPGGNMTGVTQLTIEVGPKRLELMHELLPAASTFALLINPNNPVIAETEQRNLEATARTLGLQLAVLNAGSEQDFDKVFASLVELRAGGLLVGSDPFFLGQSARLAELAQRHRMPAVYIDREFAVAGGLVSYGGDVADSYRIAGVYTGRILKGDKPADLPVQQSTKVELVINLKAAKALGLAFPPALLGRADEIIE
jgi:putative ABC transport system substrate-binding protein